MALWILLALVLACPLGAWASQPVLLDPVQGRINLAPRVDILEDADAQMTFKQASETALASRYKPHTGQEIDIGHSRSVWWLRFRLQYPPAPGPTALGPQSRDWFLEVGKPGLGQIDLFVPTPGGWVVKRSGAQRPGAHKEVTHRSFVFRLPGDAIAGDYCYLRIKSVVSINFALLLWTPSEYVAWTLPDFFGFGILYGIMIGMIAYNLFLFTALGDRTYLYYVLYMSAILLHLSILYGQVGAFINLSAGLSLKLLWVSAGGAWVCAAIFCRSFLDLKRQTPLLDKTIIGIIILSVGTIVMGLTGYPVMANLLNNILLIFAPLTLVVAGVICVRHGFAPAKFFMAAWAVLLVGLVLYSLGGVVIERTFITRYTLAIGVAVESMLLSLALAARIRSLRLEGEALRQRERYLKHLSITDGLTGLYNKRFLLKNLAGEVNMARRKADGTLSLLVLDVDDFKKFNDSHGHDQGDKVLVALALIMQDCARASDKACRFGGEEFALVLPGANRQNAWAVAERIRSTFADMEFGHGPDGAMRCSVSIGLAEMTPEDNHERLFKRADVALYQAKAEHKNRTIMA